MFILLIFIVLIPVYLLFMILQKDFPKIDRITKPLKSLIFWNYPLRFILESYINLTLFAIN